MAKERTIGDGAPQPTKVTWAQVFNEIAQLREDIRDFKEATRHDTEKTR